MEKSLDFFEKKEIYYSLLVLIVFFFSLYQFNIIKDYKQPPACLYGCDLYNHVGKIFHLYDGGSYFRDGANPNVNPWVPSFHHQLIAWYGKIFGMDVFFAYDSFTVVAGILCIIVVFFLFKMIFNKAIFGLLAVLLYLPAFPVFKYTPFAAVVIIPLFFLAFYYFYKKKNIVSALILGLVFGVVANTSSNAFIAEVVFIAFAFFYMVIPEILKLKGLNKKELKKEIFSVLKIYVLPFAIVTVLGMALSMLYWYEPIFVHHMDMKNMQGVYDNVDLGKADVFFKEIFTYIKNLFFAFQDVSYSFFSVAMLLFLLFLFLFKSKEKSLLKSFALLCFYATLVATFSFVVTFPLLKINLLAGWLYYFLFTTTKVIVAFYIFLCVLKIIESKKKSLSVHFFYAFIVLIIALSVFGIHQSYVNHKNDMFAENAKYSLDPARSDVQSWVRKNTDVNDVFLTTNENSFALNGMTGRKMMTFRRSHSNQFLDFSKIMADAAVVLYGNNTELTKSLLKQYDVKYFYWDLYWFRSEFQFDQNGQLAFDNNGLPLFFDPLVVLDTKQTRDYLDQNNVRYVPKHWYIDPGVQYEGIPQYDLLFILPHEFNMTKPWSDTFEQFISPVKEAYINQDVFAKIYSINTE